MTETFTKLVKEEIENHIDKTEHIDIRRASINKVLVKKDLRIKFVKFGLVYDPSLGHHLEFSFKKVDDANDTLQELSIYGISGKLSINTVRNRHIVYVTDEMSIMNVLKLLGATDSLRIYRETVEYNNLIKDTTRKCNFETANIHRSANASIKQLDEIKRLLKKRKIESLDKDLREVIIARQKYPDLNLSELAEKMGHLSKSAINHRFIKIRRLLNDLT